MLCERFISKLKNIAVGNGLKQEDIVVFEKQETTVPLKATLFLRGECEMAAAASNKSKAKAVHSAKELAEAIDTQKKEFFNSKKAKDEAVQEVLKHENKGWGLENALVTLPDFCQTYAAKEVCPRCRGATAFVCNACSGTGREICSNCNNTGYIFCYHCNEQGYDANNNLCTYCNGYRKMPCLQCSRTGYVPCHVCGGTARTTCEACKGVGSIIVNSELLCGVKTRFAADFFDLPSGLKKGIDKIGIAELGKSHTDVTVNIIKGDEADSGIGTQEFPALEYTADIPYAEIKMSLKGKKALVSLTGKKGVAAGVPNFLDVPLKELLDAVQTQSNSSFAMRLALKTKAFREMLAIVLEKGLDRKPSLLAMKRLYPFGLSDNMILIIFKTLSASIKKATLFARVTAGILSVSLVSLLLYFYAANLWNFSLVKNSNYPVILSFVIDIAVLLGSILVCLIVLNSAFAAAVHYIAHKLGLKIKLNARNIMPTRLGKLGFSVIFAIMFVFLLLFLLYPHNSLWLSFVRNHGF
ncbi:MAG: hypothetical protein FWF23_03005 [Alphaproteobacteria bacterium]|nr:hypothetical protein [Alphaproteobacteria bacterium]MCL2504897.1 hypothetical protein [Alphaproteobacteria bacterium]